MKGDFKKINNIEFEICAAPDSLFIELLDNNGDAFMNIEYTDDKEYKINFYKSTEHISFPLEKLEKGIEILRCHVKEIE